MSKFFASVVLLATMAAPAFAQSYDPSVGSGNIGQVIVETPFSAYAQQLRMDLGRAPAAHAAQPFTASEKALFDRIPIE